MKLSLQPTQVMLETKQAQKGMVWILELLVFVAVFFVATIAEAFFIVPAQFIAMFTDKAYMQAAQSADANAMMEATNALNERLMNADWYMVLMLFANLGLIAITFLFCRLLQRRKLRTLGFVKKGMLKEYGIGLVVGFAFFSACVGIGLLTKSLKFEGISAEFAFGSLVIFFLGYMIQGMAEEVLCRGYFLGSYARRYSVGAAVLATSLFFAALHLFNAGISVLAFINLTLFGVFASLYFIRRGSIWGIGAFHTIWNWTQGNLFGIKVSGTTIGSSLFSFSSIEGKEWLNGGAFGMEGGLICTFIYVIGIIWLLLSKNKEVLPAEQKPDNLAA